MDVWLHASFRLGLMCMADVGQPSHTMSQDGTISPVGQRKSWRRLWRHPSTVLITGATGGIGAALARSYARPGRTLILHGRNESRLASVTRECEMRGAQVHGMTFDLRDADAAIAA